MDKLIITPLGTVSPYCKKIRNCPGFLVRNNRTRILLDCGNGTTGLLHFPDDLFDLTVIITHYHKDHFGDFGAIQYASYVWKNSGFLTNKIKVFMPKEDYQNSKSSILYNTQSFMDYRDIDEDKEYNIDKLRISFYDNGSHSINTYLVKIYLNDLKMVYTSDVGKNNFNELINFCRDVDLLICESSLLKKHNSRLTTHLTAYDSGLLAREANVKRLLLTHFWPEENKKEYLKEAEQVFDNVDVAIEGKKLILKK